MSNNKTNENRLELASDYLTEGVIDLLTDLENFRKNKQSNKRSDIDADDLMMHANLLESAGKTLAVKVQYLIVIDKLKTIEIKQPKQLK